MTERKLITSFSAKMSDRIDLTARKWKCQVMNESGSYLGIGPAQSRPSQNRKNVAEFDETHWHYHRDAKGIPKLLLSSKLPSADSPTYSNDAEKVSDNESASNSTLDSCSRVSAFPASLS